MDGLTDTHSIIILIIVTLGCFTSITQTADNPTRCFKCFYYEASNDNNFVVEQLLKLLSSAGHEECKMDNPNQDKFDVDVVTCPPSVDSSKVNKCGLVSGRVTTTYKGFTVHWDTTVRDCVLVPKGNSEFSGCKQGTTISEPVKYLLDEVATKAKEFNIDATVEFSGETCYDPTNAYIEEAPLQCVSCTRRVVESSHGLTDSVLSLFTKLSDHECLMENPDDKYELGSRICPYPAQGNKAACGIIGGEVSGSALGIGILYKTTDRGCVEQPASQTLIGCTDDLPSTGTIQNLIKQGLDNVLSDVKFSGKVCYNNNGYGIVTKEGLVASADRPGQPSLFMMLMFSFITVLTKCIL